MAHIFQLELFPLHTKYARFMFFSRRIVVSVVTTLAFACALATGCV